MYVIYKTCTARNYKMATSGWNDFLKLLKLQNCISDIVMYGLGCSYNCTKIEMLKTVYCWLEISNIVYPFIQPTNQTVHTNMKIISIVPRRWVSFFKDLFVNTTYIAFRNDNELRTWNNSANGAAHCVLVERLICGLIDVHPCALGMSSHYRL